MCVCVYVFLYRERELSLYIYIYIYIYIYTDISIHSFPGGSNGKESTCYMGDLGLIPGLGRSP